jgi:cytosine/adenosine deaminase-related metal-dependent hydrolase
MTKIVYEIIEHDHGWAFRLGDTISQSFLTHEAAYNAAKRAAMEQMRPGQTVGISWEDEARTLARRGLARRRSARSGGPRYSVSAPAGPPQRSSLKSGRPR